MKDQSTPQLRERYHDLVRNDVIPFVLPKGGALLDVGGGIGATALKLKDLGYADRVGVVDLVAPAGQSRAPDFHYAGNLEAPEPIDTAIREQGPFQTILCLDILEHLVDPWAVVARLHRALAPNGQIVASIPNVRNFQILFPLLFRGEWKLADSGLLDRTHLRFFVRDTAAELMTSSGLQLDLIVGKPSGRKAAKLVRSMALGMLDDFIAFQWIVRVIRRD